MCQRESAAVLRERIITVVSHRQSGCRLYLVQIYEDNQAVSYRCWPGVGGTYFKDLSSVLKTFLLFKGLCMQRLLRHLPVSTYALTGGCLRVRWRDKKHVSVC